MVLDDNSEMTEKIDRTLIDSSNSYNMLVFVSWIFYLGKKLSNWEAVKYDILYLH